VGNANWEYSTKCREREWGATAAGMIGLSGYCTGNDDTASVVLAVAALVLGETV